LNSSIDNFQGNIDAAARGYIRKDKNFTIAKGVIGVV